MAQVRMTRQARADLASIVAYYEQVSPAFAVVFEENLLASMRQLETFPRMGRVVPEIRQASMREILYRSYRIVYFVDDADEEVEVLTIFPSSRPFGSTSRAGDE
jgi:toxin ParE1/3/4